MAIAVKETAVDHANIKPLEKACLILALVL